MTANITIGEIVEIELDYVSLAGITVVDDISGETVVDDSTGETVVSD